MTNLPFRRAQVIYVSSLLSRRWSKNPHSHAYLGCVVYSDFLPKGTAQNGREGKSNFISMEPWQTPPLPGDKD